MRKLLQCFSLAAFSLVSWAQVRPVRRIIPPIPDGVLWVGNGPGQYRSLAACYEAIPMTGGTCLVSPNWFEALSADLVLSKANAGFIFMGPATIALGTSQVIINQGATGAFFVGLPPLGAGAFDSANVVAFIYTGSGNAFQFGTPGSTQSVDKARIENIFIDLSSAGSSAVAINGFWTGHSIFTGLLIANSSASNSQKGLVLNNAGPGFSGGNRIDNLLCSSIKNCLQLNDSSVENTINHVVMTGFSVPGGIGVDFEGNSDSNVLTGGTISGYPTGVNFGGNANHNVVTVELDSGTTDVAFGPGTTRNRVVRMNSTGQPVPVIVNNGKLNLVTDPGGIVFAGGNLLSEQGATVPLTGDSTDKTVYSYTLPGGALQPGHGVRIQAWFTHTGGSAPVTYKLFFGSGLYASASTPDNGHVLHLEDVVFNDSGATNSQHGAIVQNLVTSQLYNAFAPITSSVDTTADVTIKLTFNAANTDQVRGGEFLVELIQ